MPFFRLAVPRTSMVSYSMPLDMLIGRLGICTNGRLGVEWDPDGFLVRADVNSLGCEGLRVHPLGTQHPGGVLHIRLRGIVRARGRHEKSPQFS